MVADILKLKKLLTLNYKVLVKENNNMTNPNKRSPLIIQLISPKGKIEELTFRNSEIDVIQCLVSKFNWFNLYD